MTIKSAEILDTLARYYGKEIVLKIGDVAAKLTDFYYDEEADVVVFEASKLISTN